MAKYVVGRGGSDSGSTSSRAAVEEANTLRSKSYAKVIDLLGEGEWEEVPVGGMKGVYLSDVVVQNQDGTFNYENITLETRPGTLTQTRMNIANTTESTDSVGVEMKYNVPVEAVVYGESADYLRATVGVTALKETDTSTGDIRGTSVSYKIEYNSSDNATWRGVPTQGAAYTYEPIAYSETTYTGYASYKIEYTINPATYFSDNQYFAPCHFRFQYRINGGAWITVREDVATSVVSFDETLIVATSDTFEVQLLAEDVASFTPQGSLITVAYGQVTGFFGGKSSAVDYVQTISGKTTSSYERQHTFRVTGESPFTVRVTRLTADSTSDYLQNKTVFQAVSAVTEEKFIYPGSVLAGLYVDATQFNSIPTRAYLCKMAKVKVPSNYDPTTRVYSGFWDGTFKVAWTDNPAWCFYDLVTNKRYGLGDRIPASYIDVAALYSIAQYCDEYVPDGLGGYEPRFTCNLYIQNQREAYKVISDMAAVFRGITYWASGAIVPVQDSLKDPVYAFTNANVEGGTFNYTGSDINTRYNAVAVTWNDPNNRYKQAVEYVSDDDLVVDMGYINRADVSAFGCTSRGQARRVGKWLLYTNTFETDIVSFVTGLEGAIPMPGDIIKVSDSLRALERMGGRVLSHTLSGAVLDAPINFSPDSTYTFAAILANGELVERTFYANGETDTITFESPLPSSLAEGSIFVITDDNIPEALFRVLAVAEKEGFKYEISASSYNPSKYKYVEEDERLTLPATVPLYVGAVEDVTATEILYADGVNVRSRIRLEWMAPPKAVKYNVFVKAPDGSIFDVKQKETHFEISNTVLGEYTARLVAYDVLGHASEEYVETFQALGKLAKPSAPTGFALKTFGEVGTAVWDTHPDLDVRVGGAIVIKHTSKTSGAQWEDGVVVAIAPGSATQTTVPLINGTYLAKAVDDGGRYSDGYAVTTSAFAATSATNVMATLIENPTFPGVKENLSVDDGLLTLVAEAKWDDIVLIDDVESIDYLGFGTFNGTYYFSDVIDLTAVYTIRAFGNVSGFAAVLRDTINSRMSPVNSWERFNGDIINNSKIDLFVATTLDDPNSVGAVWSEWTPFILTDYTARGFKFKLEMSVQTDEHAVFIQELSVSVDAVDRVLGKDNVAVGTSGYNVVFDGAFAETPAIAISIDGMQNGDYYEFSDKSAAGFTVVIKNGGTPVARQIDWIAKGYGRKIT